MDGFSTAQQRIAEICRTPENTPATAIFFDEVEPRGSEMLASLEAILN